MENHNRYFIYKVEGDGEIEYRYQTGEWRYDFTDAQLWASKEFAIKKAKALREQYIKWYNRSPETLSVYVGTVKVTYNEQDWEEVE